MSSEPVPVLLVTGFLGAGKTTFLNWLIHTHPHLNISLVLNEFGNIQLESQFIKEDSGGQIVELSNGCMCCVAKSDIPRIIQYILDESPQTRYILIEASGLSDPDPIYEVLHTPPLSEKIYVAGTICIVDALNFESTRTAHPIVLSQIGDADVVLISKVKEAGIDKVTDVRKFISNLNGGTNILEFTDALDPHLFLDADIPGCVDKPPASDDGKHHHDHEQMQEYWYKSDKKVNVEKITVVLQQLPEGIIRAKGFINTNSGKHLVQYVGGKLEIIPDIWENSETPSTALLFLGQSYDSQALQTSLSSCVDP